MNHNYLNQQGQQSVGLSLGVNHSRERPDAMANVTLSDDNVKATRQTLKLMAGLAKEGAKNADVFTTARCIVAPLPNKAYRLEAQAIYNWVVMNIRYTRDIKGVETLQHPDYTLRIRQGDCDDHAILIAALLLSVGHEAMFTAVKDRSGNGQFCHVYCETMIGNKWLTMDTTLPEYGMGFIHPNAYSPMSHRL